VAVTVVQSALYPETLTSSPALAFTSPTTTGNTIVVGLEYYFQGGGTIPSDPTAAGDGTNTLAQAPGSSIGHLAVSFAPKTVFWYCANITGQTTDTITVTLPGTYWTYMTLWELTASAFDQATVNTASTGTSISAGSITPPVNGALLLGLWSAADTAAGWTLDGGWTAGQTPTPAAAKPSPPPTHRQPPPRSPSTPPPADPATGAPPASASSPPAASCFQTS
jgi:hypothetical protein